MDFLKKAFHFLKKKDTKSEKIEQFEVNNDINISPQGDCLDINAIINNKDIIKNEKNNGILKLIIILFLLYIFISSKFFTSTILKLCGSKFINNNKPTFLGTILQGIFLVIFYMLLAHLVKESIL